MDVVCRFPEANLVDNHNIPISQTDHWSIRATACLRALLRWALIMLGVGQAGGLAPLDITSSPDSHAFSNE